MPKQDQEHRQFERFPIGFVVEVHLMNPDGSRQRIETAELKDVSGGGVRFVSAHSETYKIGQRLHLSIFLPGTGKVTATMEGNASVVWVGTLENGGVSVGVKLDDLMNFGRGGGE